MATALLIANTAVDKLAPAWQIPRPPPTKLLLLLALQTKTATDKAVACLATVAKVADEKAVDAFKPRQPTT